MTEGRKADEPGDVTRLLRASGQGDRAAAGALYERLETELHAIATAYLAGRAAGHTLQATSLVNEAYLRLVRQEGTAWSGRTHFLAVAAKAMRSVLIDHARKKQRLKRGGARERVPLVGLALADGERPYDMLELEEALAALERRDPTGARLFELRFFGGLDTAEAAEHLGLAPRSARRKWRMACAWLQRALGPGDGAE